MADEYGIKISQSGQNVYDPELPAYQFQALSTRNALKEKSHAYGSSDYAHGVSAGLPLVMRSRRISSTIAESVVWGGVTTTNVDLPATGTYRTRVFYNNQPLT